MIEGFTLRRGLTGYFWSDEIYYKDIFPLIKNDLSNDEIFIMSKWEDDFSKHNQKLYCANIKNISINYQHDGKCDIVMSLYSYRLKMDIVFCKVSNFRFFQDNETNMFHEIYGVYIVFDKQERTKQATKRFYFLCPYFPEKERAFHFIEYANLTVDNLEIYDTVVTDNGIVVQHQDDKPNI